MVWSSMSLRMPAGVGVDAGRPSQVVVVCPLQLRHVAVELMIGSSRAIRTSPEKQGTLISSRVK